MSRLRPFGLAAGVVALTLGVLVGPFAATGAADPRDEGRARRVFVFSLPHVSWEDLDTFAGAVPNLRRFLDRAAVAGLTSRADQRATKLADGYLTLGTGTRTVGDPTTDGDGYSLVIVDQAGDLLSWNDGVSWRPSGALGGGSGTVSSRVCRDQPER